MLAKRSTAKSVSTSLAFGFAPNTKPAPREDYHRGGSRRSMSPVLAGTVSNSLCCLSAVDLISVAAPGNEAVCESFGGYRTRKARSSQGGAVIRSCPVKNTRLENGLPLPKVNQQRGNRFGTIKIFLTNDAT